MCSECTVEGFRRAARSRVHRDDTRDVVSGSRGEDNHDMVSRAVRSLGITQDETHGSPASEQLTAHTKKVIVQGTYIKIPIKCSHPGLSRTGKEQQGISPG